MVIAKRLAAVQEQLTELRTRAHVAELAARHGLDPAELQVEYRRILDACDATRAHLGRDPTFAELAELLAPSCGMTIAAAHGAMLKGVLESLGPHHDARRAEITAELAVLEAQLAAEQAQTTAVLELPGPGDGGRAPWEPRRRPDGGGW